MGIKYFTCEFDNAVKEYIQWCKSVEKSRKRDRLRIFFKELFKGSTQSLDISIDPFYFKPNLTLQQKSAIVCASELKRSEKDLDNIISGHYVNIDIPLSEVKHNKEIICQLYSHYKHIYKIYNR